LLDIKFIRQNPDAVKKGAADKQVDVDVDLLLELDAAYREKLAGAEQLRAEQKRQSKEKRGEVDKEAMRALREEQREAETEAEGLKRQRDDLLLQVPNLPHESVPFGRDESENVVVRKWGEPRKFDFEPRNHIALGEALDIIDIERAAKTSGSRFYYLKGAAVMLEFALVQMVMALLAEDGFVPVVPPVMVKREVMQGGGYLPGGEDEIYKTAKDDLYLVGTSEQSILGMHGSETFGVDDLPLRYVGFSTCFRREAGSYGKDVRGILRVHQFDKVEMFSFCSPSASWDEHELLVAQEEKVLQALEIPYQVVLMCSGDLGAPAAKKFDMEAWIPTEGKYRETHSCSNCTDFQARRMGIKYRPEPGASPEILHTLNGTAVAIGRVLIAIMENYQQPDGTIVVPEALRRYAGGLELITPRPKR